MNGPGLTFARLAADLAAPASALADAWVEAVVRASVQGGLAVAAVWLLLRVVPRIPPAVTTALWWAVCLKLAVALAWGWPVAAPLAAHGAPSIAASYAGPEPDPAALRPGNAGPAPVPPAERSPSAIDSAGGPPAPGATPMPAARLAGTLASPLAAQARLEAALTAAVPAALRPALLFAWLLGLGAVALVSSGRRRRLRSVLAAAEPVAEAGTLALVERLSGRLGVRAPSLLVSDRVASPLVAGPFRPRIVLPSAALAGPPDELEMLLLHELVHLRRRDLILGLVPALAGRLLFFHPLAALAVREHLLAREAACDAEVVRRLDAAPRAYGRLLLRWGVVPATARPSAAVAAQNRNHLKRRLLMLADTASTRRSRTWLAVAVLPAAALLLPIRWTTETSAAPPPREGQIQTAATEATAPAAPAPVRTVHAVTSVSAPSSPTAVARVAVVNQARPDSTTTVEVGWDDSGDGYAVLDGNGYSNLGGGYWHADRARELRRSPGEPLFLFRRDGQTWVVRDPDLVAAAIDAIRPMQELGEQQGHLGGEQGELGGRQGALGGEMGKLGGRQSELGGEMGMLGGRLGPLVAEKVRLESERGGARGRDDAATAARLAELDREIDGIESQMKALGEKMRALGEEQRELGERQRALGESQQELGARQRALGMKQKELAGHAKVKLAELADRAAATGRAEKVE